MQTFCHSSLWPGTTQSGYIYIIIIEDTKRHFYHFSGEKALILYFFVLVHFQKNSSSTGLNICFKKRQIK